ncbi:MAG: FAD-dependent oxidoreductase [Syntrophomonadaceae bacterium]
MTTDLNKRALVVGAGLAGMEGALKIGSAGYEVYLVEKEDTMGGVTNKLYCSFPRWENPRQLLDDRITQINNTEEIRVMTGTVIKSARRDGDRFVVDLQKAGNQTEQVAVDAVVLATGFELMDASVYGEYGYGIYPNVLNSLEFEARLKEWSSGSRVDTPKSVAFFKCVGSRDRSKGYPYCSKICCMYTAKQAGLTRELLPETKAYVFYMDYRAAGKEYEEFVRSVIETKHVRYVRGRPAKVLPENGRLLVRAEDTLMGVPIEVEVDMVVLASAAVPRKETKALAEMFGAKTDQYGFLENESFNPCQTGDRVFFAGACGFAIETAGAQTQGAAAAAEVVALFNRAGQEAC